MVYGILRVFAVSPAVAAAGSAAAMLALELFQLTMIPAQLLARDQWVVRMGARLLGVHFSALDLVAYAVGIALIHLADSRAPLPDSAR